MVPAAKRAHRCTGSGGDNNHPKFCVRYALPFCFPLYTLYFLYQTKERLHSLIILFLILRLSISSNTTNEHSASYAGSVNDYFMRAACPKALARAAPRREPETILLDEIEEADDAGEAGEEGRPIPVQVGYRPGDSKRVLKRQLANTDNDNDCDIDGNNTTTTATS